MNMQQLKQDFFSGKVPKAEYIKRMHDFHQSLFDYADFIGTTDIASIEITAQGVVMTTRERGIRLLCDPVDHRIVPMEILNFGQYEKEECDMILNLIDENATVYDIGGNFGWYSLNIAKTRDVNIYAFEPVPKTFGFLQKNVALNGFQNIHCFNFGFSDCERDLTFYYYPEGSGNASSANLSEGDNVETITCRVRTLDDFVKEQQTSVDFIKCDVEGAELLVFMGGRETISRHRPIIFAELLRKWAAKFSYHPNAVIELLQGIDYRCFVIREGKLLEFFNVDDQTMETNFFFLHAQKHAHLIARFTG